MQDVLLRKVGDHLAFTNLGYDPVEHKPRLAGQTPGGGAARMWDGDPQRTYAEEIETGSMVLLETLRLYSPVVLIARRVERDITMANINIPKDTGLIIPITIIHGDNKIWGADANEFNPLRFENGISKAVAHPNAFLSFSIGPRVCIG
ncbi:cytochrome P450 [Musa troglodytarum]|uniref:Cytochrome P450 n=1 Tax=Musa troglodytarum TaxID=320322 RepID=A0A9E7I8Q3_9LILI|nr:cytochrome P450 [Musa troglodytarum]